MVKAKSIENAGKQKDIDLEERQRESVNEKLPVHTELENRISNLASRLIEHYKKYVYPEWYQIIKMKEKFSGDMQAVNIMRGHDNRSCMVYPLIEAVFDTYVSNLFDTNTTSKAIARNKEDREKAEDAQDFFDWAYTVSDADYQKEVVRNEACLIGTSYGMAAVVGEDNYIYMDGDVDNFKEVEQDLYRPYVEHISAFQMYVEPSTKNFYKARYKMLRKIVPFKDMESLYGWTGSIEQRKDIILKSNDFVSTEDFTKIYNISAYYDDYVTSCVGHLNTIIEGADFTEGDFIYDNMFQIDYATDKLCEVIEYREKDNLVIMINGYVVYDGLNPYGIDPFGVITYEKRPGTHFGNGIGQKLMSHQRQVNTVWNAINDGINQHIRPMYTAVKGTLKGADGQEPERISRRDGRVVYVSNPNARNGGIEPLQFIDFNVISLSMRHMQTLLTEAQEIIGTNSYVQGGQGKVERSFGAVNARLGVTRSRLQPIIKTINKFDEKMFQSRLAISSIVMKDGVMVRVLGDDGVDDWKEIHPSDVINKFDIVVENEAVRQATKLERANIMLQSLQTMLPNMYDPNTGMPIGDIRGILQYALDQNNFVGIDVFNKAKIEEYINDQVSLASMFAIAQQQVQAELQSLQGPSPEQLQQAIQGPLDGLQSQIGLAEEGGALEQGGDQAEQNVPQQFQRGVLPQ